MVELMKKDWVAMVGLGLGSFYTLDPVRKVFRIIAFEALPFIQPGRGI